MGDRGTTRPIAGTFFYILLALVDEPRYGLGIVDEVASRTGGDVTLGPGTLYNAIKKMLDGGLIEEWAPPGGASGADPRRRYYRITREGRALVAEEAARLEQLVLAARAKRVIADT
jgi:DNA-binding PadR family transcriptional regulator